MRDTTCPVPYRKGRPANVIGAHCVMEYQGRTLLGTVEAIAYQDGARPAYIATVRHFNGEEWPVAPCVGSIRLLDRTA